MFKQVKQFVDNSRPDFKSHYQNTVDWLLKLYPDADEVVQSAAYAHDIERSFRKASEKNIVVYKKIRCDDAEYLEKHQVKGAEIIKRFLESKNFPKQDIKRICNIISHHEVGGDVESDMVMNADSLSYFDVNSKRHVDKFLPIIGKEKVMIKLDFMYKRISSAEIKKLARPMYETAVKYLVEQSNE